MGREGGRKGGKDGTCESDGGDGDLSHFWGGEGRGGEGGILIEGED